MAVSGKQLSKIVKLLAGTNGTVCFKLMPAPDQAVFEQDN